MFCFAALLTEIKHVDASTAIAPINIYDNDNSNYITDRASLPDNFTKLGKWLMISGGSWVFDKKEKGFQRGLREIPPQVARYG